MKIDGVIEIFCVLGMHRSGTSCLIASLEEAGVYVGQVSRQDPHNLKGNHELSVIVDLHEDLLAANGCAWDRPRSDITWSDSHRLELDRIIASFHGSPKWGFKDPRTVMTLGGWLEKLPKMQIVGIFRNPWLVAKSLALRNGFTMEKGYDLWFWYNQQILNYHQRLNFPIVSFDDPAEVLHTKMASLFGSLNLPTSAEKLTFFDESLRTAPSLADEHTALPDKVTMVHDKLKDLSYK